MAVVAWNTYSKTIERAAELLGKEALASRLNVSVGTINRWITGERLPAIRHFLAAVDILDELVFVQSAYGELRTRCRGHPSTPSGNAASDHPTEA